MVGEDEVFRGFGFGLWGFGALGFTERWLCR